MRSTVIYQWPDSRGYLANVLMPDATCLAAAPGETNVTVLERLKSACECFWFHLNATMTTNFPADRPALLASLLGRRIEVVNGNVTDISKRYVQQFNREHGFQDVSAPQEGDPNELLILKTNYNCIGDGERYMSALQQDRLGLKRSEAVPEGFKYRVGPRSTFEPACWANPAFVLERFIHNEWGIWYRAMVRRPKIALCQFQSPAQIKKDGGSRLLQIMWLRSDDHSVRSGSIGSLVLRFIGAFRLDFGAVDVVTDLKGVATVVDVNPTPWGGGQPGVEPYLTSD